MAKKKATATGAQTMGAGNEPAERATLEIAGRDDLIALVEDGAIGDSSFSTKLVTAEVAAAPTFDVEGLALSVSAGAGVEIGVFNSVDDDDGDGILTTTTGETEDVEPPILKAGTGAWLKFRFLAHAKATGSFQNPILVASASGQRELALCDYRAHRRDEPTRSAVANDVGSIRIVTQASDLAALGPNDALAFRTTGELKFALKLSWADVFSSNLGGFLARLAPNRLVAIKTSASASISAAVSATDEFVVAFVGRQDRRIDVVLRKADQKLVTLDAKAGVNVEFEDQETVEKLLEALVASAVGKPMSRIDAVLAKTDVTKLSEADRELLDRLVGTFGLGDVADRLEDVRDRWSELKGKLTEGVEAIARAKFESGFRYEYQRIGSQATLLRAILSVEKARALHGAILRCDIAALQAAKGQDGVEISKFLQEEKREVSRAWGFSLGLGKWHAAGKDKKEFRFSRQRNLAESQATERVAYHGVRGYEYKTKGKQVAWSVDVKADTSRFAPEVRVRDLYLGLHFHYEHAEGKMSEEELRQAIDEAIVWRVLDEADEERVYRETRAAASANSKVSTRLDLKFDHPSLASILPLVSPGDLDGISRALGRALPWWNVSEARQVVPIREQVYAPLWKWALTEANVTGAKAAKKAFETLLESGIGKDAAGDERNAGHACSFGWHVEVNRRTRESWEDFAQGFVDLRNAIALGDSHDRMKTILKRLQTMFRQFHHVRAAAAYVSELALRAGDGIAKPEGTFTVALPSGEELTFATSRA